MRLTALSHPAAARYRCRCPHARADGHSGDTRPARRGDCCGGDNPHQGYRAAQRRRHLQPRRASRADRLNWKALARCEAGGNPRARNPAGYYGLYQFTVATWRGVGGHGYPNHASRSEQTLRAKKLFQRAGSSPWPTCGHLLYV